LVALSPVLVGTALTFGLLCWLEIGFSVLLIVVIPLLVGLGVDDGIHIAHRLRHDKESSPAAAVSAVGHAILMTTLTTCGGVLALLFSNHPGMESMSLTLLIGLPSCLLASVTVAPALARMLQLRS
jgi:predicted RND superfamily exporter protein